MRVANRYSALAPMSMAPPAMAILATGATMRNGGALTSAMTPNSVTETARAATRGHIPAWASVSARARTTETEP